MGIVSLFNEKKVNLKPIENDRSLLLTAIQFNVQCIDDYLNGGVWPGLIIIPALPGQFETRKKELVRIADELANENYVKSGYDINWIENSLHFYKAHESLTQDEQMSVVNLIKKLKDILKNQKALV